MEIFYEAIKNKSYECFLSDNTALPMLYMPDAIRATIDLMEADRASLTINSAYNLGGFSVTPKKLYEEIRTQIPEFKIKYNPDFRQAIADSWPQSIDDSVAKKDWGCYYDYDLKKMSVEMLREIGKKLEG